MTKKFHQQELDNQYGLQPSTSDSGHQQHQVPNISQRKNLISYNKMISSPFSLLYQLKEISQIVVIIVYD